MGQPVSAELPNITGELTKIQAGSSTTQASGAFSRTELGNRTSANSGSAWSEGNIHFNASKCSSIYKDSATTVVPESLITNFYIRY